jgi:hypothetical protein
VRESIELGIQQGLSIDEMRALAIESAGLDAGYADTVVRTTVASAYGQGRMDVILEAK